MPPSPISPFDYDQEPMSVSVFLNGQLLDENILIQHLAVNSSVNYPAKAVLTMEAGKEFKAADFNLGNPVLFRLGYGLDTTIVFEGIILQQAITENASGGTTIKILCISIAPVIKMEAPYTELLNGLPGPFLKLTLGTDIIDYTITACKRPDRNNPDWFCGQFRFPGSALAAIHTLINIDKELQPHYLEYPYIASVEHVVEKGGWVTRVVLGEPEMVDFREG